MTNAPSEFCLLSARLTKLERQNRLFRRAIFILLIGIGAVLLMAQAAPKHPIIAEKMITTERLVLADAEGRVRASFYADANEKGPSLILYDLKNKPRMSFFLDQDEPVIDLFSAKQSGGVASVRSDQIELTDSSGRVVSASMVPTVAGFTVEDASTPRASLVLNSDYPGLVLFGRDHKPTVLMNDDENGPTLRLWDVNGYSASLGVEGSVNPQTGEMHKTSAASLVLFDKDKQVIWKAP